MKHKVLLNYIMLICILFTSCNLFNNDNTKPKEYEPADRDYLLINKTPHDNLKLYLSKNESDSCATLDQIATVNREQTFPIHVSKSERLWIYYCTQIDDFCKGCRKKELKGETTWNKNIILN